MTGVGSIAMGGTLTGVTGISMKGNITGLATAQMSGNLMFLKSTAPSGYYISAREDGSLGIFTLNTNWTWKTNVAAFSPNGYFGIGTLSPSCRLDVEGQARITSGEGDGKALTVKGGIAATGAFDTWGLNTTSYAAFSVEVGYSPDATSSFVPLLAAYKRGNPVTLTANKLFHLSVNRAGTSAVFQFGSAIAAWLTSGGQLSVTTALIGGKARLSYDSATAGLQCSTGFYSPKSISARGASTSSDIRLKQNLRGISLTTAQIAAAPAVRFQWISDGSTDCGTIAQYWQQVLPETVGEYGGTLTLDYSRAALLSAVTNARTLLTHAGRLRQLESTVKRQQEEIKAQRGEIARLKKKLSIN